MHPHVTSQPCRKIRDHSVNQTPFSDVTTAEAEDFSMLDEFFHDSAISLFVMSGSHWAFLSVADAFPMEIDKHQAMFRRYNRTFCE